MKIHRHFIFAKNNMPYPDFPSVILTLLLLVLGCNGSSLQTCSPDIGKTMIEFTTVPTYGNSGKVFGRIGNADPNEFAVAVYTFIEGSGWWTRPDFDNPIIPIQSDSTWIVDIGAEGEGIYTTQIRAYLLPIGVTPPVIGSTACLPETLTTISTAVIDTMLSPRSISFGGYDWRVKESFKPVGPGPNIFSGNPGNVWIDESDRLHLKITYKDEVWYCPEVILDTSLGYGKYVFQVSSRVGNVDENAVVGLFIWDNNGCEEHFREIDIEFSRWGNAQNATNAQYVVQPWDIPGNVRRWHIPPTIDSSTHSFKWSGESINYSSVKGHRMEWPTDSAIYSWTYTGPHIPSPDAENIRINLWLFNGSPPSDGKEIELIVSGFTYISPESDSAKK